MNSRQYGMPICWRTTLCFSIKTSASSETAASTAPDKVPFSHHACNTSPSIRHPSLEHAKAKSKCHTLRSPGFLLVDHKVFSPHPLMSAWSGQVRVDIQLSSWNAFCYSQLRRLTGSNDIVSDIFLTYLLTFFLTYLLTFFLTYLLTCFLTYILTFFLTYQNQNLTSTASQKKQLCKLYIYLTPCNKSNIHDWVFSRDYGWDGGLRVRWRFTGDLNFLMALKGSSPRRGPNS